MEDGRDLPATTERTAPAAVSPERQAKVDTARRAWISRLVDTSRRNNLLFYRETKNGTLDLTGADANGVTFSDWQ